MTVEEMLARQRALIEATEKDNRDMTPDEQREFDSLTQQIQRAKEKEGETDRASGSGDSSDGDSESDDDKENGRALAIAEQQRALQIMDICEGTGLNARELIANGTSVARARLMANEAMVRNYGPLPQKPYAGEGVQHDEQDKFRSAAVDALVMRAGVALEKPAAGARDLMGMSLRDTAIRCLASEGVASMRDLISADPWDLFELAKRSYQPRINSRAFMQPTGQFPVFLDQAIEKALVDFYKHPEYEFEKIVKVGTLSDFKTHDNDYMSGPVGDFVELPEGGTMQEDTFEYVQLGHRKLKTHAKRFSMTYQAFVDDDIGALAEMPRKFARAWRRTLNNKVFGILVGNSVMGDGAKLFSGPHSNLLSKGTGVTSDALRSMQYYLQRMKNPFGESIQVKPTTLILPTGLEYDLETLFKSATIQTPDNTQAANPFYNVGLEVVRDDTINKLADDLGLESVPWYLAGAADDAPGIEIDYLNGKSELQKRMGQPMDQLGFVWNFWGFAGVTALDYRRYVMNPGIKIEPPIEAAK